MTLADPLGDDWDPLHDPEEVFLPDDEPAPDPRDFWIEPEPDEDA